MGFFQSIKHCFANATKSKGRGSRSEFWWFFLYYLMAVYGGTILMESIDSPFAVLVWLAVIFYHVITLMNAGFRRMHDIGKHGIFYFIPIINLIFLATAGDTSANKYGEPIS